MRVRKSGQPHKGWKASARKTKETKMAEVKRISCDTRADIERIISERKTWAKLAAGMDKHGSVAEFNLTIELAEKLLNLQLLLVEEWLDLTDEQRADAIMRHKKES